MTISWTYSNLERPLDPFAAPSTGSVAAAGGWLTGGGVPVPALPHTEKAHSRHHQVGSFVRSAITRILTNFRNAELKEYIAAGVSKDEFTRRMKAALTATQQAPLQPAPQSAPQPVPMAAPTAATSQLSHADASSTSSSGQATPPSPPGSRAAETRAQSLLAERAAKLADKRKKEEDEARRQRTEKAEANAQAEASGSKKADEQSKHAAALKKRQREAREERERILKAIEDDKVARKAKQAEAEADRKAAAAAEKAPSAPFAAVGKPLPSTAGRLSTHCALQVRLFDGSTIRNRFPSNATLKDVRKWVDEARKDGKEAYTFKVLLTPLPSKTIDVAEEDKSLQALELTPSSTLILLRVPKYTSVYSSSAVPHVAGAPQGNAFQRLIAYFLANITSFFGTISALFSTFFSTSGPPAATSEPATSQTSQSQTTADAARRRGGRIAGVDNTDGRRNDQQFYNGNSVSDRCFRSL